MNRQSDDPPGWDGEQPEDRDDVTAAAQDCAAGLADVVTSVVRRVGPETTEHLLRAAREVGLALRTVIEGLAEIATDLDSRRVPDQLQSIQIRGTPARPRPGDAADPEAPAGAPGG
ncbi:MAG TPA: hypothetical protein VNE62_13330 [Actinomycetota bacterium]|nr:hypothetical protein [Actinomycetota bacterium]